MDFEECRNYTFDEKILHYINLLRDKKYSAFQKESGLKVVETKTGLVIGKQKMPMDPEDFTFSLIKLVVDESTEKWETLSQKRKAELFQDFFWNRVQKYGVKERRKLFLLLDHMLSEKTFESHVVIKNGELVDFKGIDFEKGKYTETILKEKGPIIWKQNTPPPSLYYYI